MFVFRNSDSPASAPLQQPRTEPHADIEEMKAEIERLYFITEALWRIIREKHGFDENEIVRQITMIDLEDGNLDQRKAKTPPKPCPKCGRVLNKQRVRCMYCGELIAVNPFER